MQSRLVAVVVVLWASLAVAATTLGTGLVGAAPQDPPQRPFSHAEHVSRTWQNKAQPEVFRDCRGCHRFSADAETSSPQAVCDECHQGAGKLTRDFAAGFTEDLSGYATRTRAAFRHHTHGMLECRQCHYDDFALLDHMPIRTGPAFCAECHEKTVTADDVRGFRWFAGAADEQVARAAGLPEAFAAPGDPAGYAAKLDEVFAGVGGGINATPLPSGGEFDHADHIDTTGGADGLACAACHTDIRGAAVGEVGTGDIPTDGCKQCHIRDAAGAAAAAKAEVERTEPRPLWSLGTFAHADHYGFLQPGGAPKDGVASDEARARIDAGEDSCKACHTYAPEVPGLSERDFPFAGDSSRHTYAACIECHTLAGWQTGEQPGSADNPPLHASNGGDGWQKCASCHVLGEPDMAGRRPTASVQRREGLTFVFEGQTHPHITSTGTARAREAGAESLEQECATCHRAVVPALPTRLIEKQFRHQTHLPSEPTAKDCTGCHPNAETAATSGALADADYRTFTLTSCKQCHWGSDVVARIAEPERAPAAREVVAFPHDAHVRADQSCAECHAPAADGRDMMTKPAALACNQCHKHQEVGGARPPERLVADEVQSCVRCHHEDASGEVVASVPPPRGTAAAASDRRYRATQTRFPGFAQSQFHPAGSTCTDCHKAKDLRGRFAAVQVPTRTDHLLSSHRLSVHADVAQGGFGRSAPADCLRCHWKSVGSWAAAVNVARREPPDRWELRKQPDSPATRAALGNRFRGYPGSDDADG